MGVYLCVFVMLKLFGTISHLVIEIVTAELVTYIFMKCGYNRMLFEIGSCLYQYETQALERERAIGMRLMLKLYGLSVKLQNICNLIELDRRTSV